MAGGLGRAASNWTQYTSDKWVLDTVTGLAIDLEALPVQLRQPDSRCADPVKDAILYQEILKLLEHGILEDAFPSDRAFVSHMFLREKSNGTFRPILNLSNLNEYTQYKHFKMDHLALVMTTVPKNSYMASIDITQAYFALPVKLRDRDLLQLMHRGKRYRFTCLPNGYSPGPRLFTRIMKALMSFLRERHGVHLMFYIDDTLIYADTPSQVNTAVQYTLEVLQSAGFTINFNKSALTPTQTIEYLGFIIHSPTLTLTIPPKKLTDILEKVENLLKLQICTIRKFSQVLGSILATDPGNDRAKVLSKKLQIAKTEALARANNNYDKFIQLRGYIKPTLREIITHLPLAKKVYDEVTPQVTLYTDSSDTGWGAYVQNTDSEYGEMWCDEIAPLHINVKEILAVHRALIHFHNTLENKHIHMYIDNTTAISCLKKGGSTKSKACNKATERVFRQAWTMGATFQLTYVPTEENVEADRASRAFSTAGEWMLSQYTKTHIFTTFHKPEIDLFAAPNNKACDKYVSLHYYPDAYATNAFTLDWSDLSVLIFPPFCLIGRVLRKLREETPRGILVVPRWSTQPWFPALTQLPTYSRRQEIRIGPRTLQWPGDPTKMFPMANKMKLLCVPL